MTNPYRDSAGKSLEDYPRPSVAVDTAVLTVPDSGRLSVLLTRTNDAIADDGAQWRLPGTFLHDGERLAEAVLRSLREKAGVEGLRPRQLRVFDEPERDDRGWVLSVAHLDVVAANRIRLVERTRIVPVDELPALQFDHEEIVAAATATLRAEYRAAPDPWALLGTEPFTVRDLRLLHEAIAGKRFNPDTFRRTMLPGLVATGELRTGARGKPAELYLRVNPVPAG
ncbi:NUDIX domain-containing protein [Terrimesophilobacter mesophilus]|uniref:NUDIX domain-containing protein n=2 Tax=Terrimesophilobacter mesophilus TaxID=433647 RepID=A0A4V3I9U7_9MICO|nr:NUDIX domain-containing protein [Terrimesophilobacter mesophilus]TFB80828.1 NUDIX domain-containing protein [Terrimesophilobacter mesophilus]